MKVKVKEKETAHEKSLLKQLLTDAIGDERRDSTVFNDFSLHHPSKLI